VARIWSWMETGGCASLDVDGRPQFYGALRTARMGAEGSRIPRDLRVVGLIPARLTIRLASNPPSAATRLAHGGPATPAHQSPSVTAGVSGKLTVYGWRHRRFRARSLAYLPGYE